jgi:phosphonoacetaldehyde hydrolase
MVDIMLEQMRQQPNCFHIDHTVAADEVENPRPFKDSCRKNLKLMELSDSTEVVKVGDTVMDIDEGRDAGMWTVGLVKYSNYVGMEPEDIKEMEKKDPKSLVKTYHQAARTLWDAKPDFLVMEITEVPFVMNLINKMLSGGANPKAVEDHSWKPKPPLYEINIKDGTYRDLYKDPFLL